MNRLFACCLLNIHKFKSFVWRYLADKEKCYGLCLMFHGVYGESESENNQSDLDVPMAFFKDAIKRLLDNGYIFVSINDGLEILKKRKQIKFAIVTFDDVSTSVYNNAYPFLVENQIPFTLFISCDYLKTEGFIDTSQMNELSKNHLCTIGSHTITHVLLRGNENLNQEIGGSKRFLEDQTKTPINYFAYPYGSCFAVDTKSINEAKKHYNAAFSTIDAPLSPYILRHRFFLPRVLVTPNSRFNDYI